MSIPPIPLNPEDEDPQLRALRQALTYARANQTAIVMVSTKEGQQRTLARLAQMLHPEERWKASFTSHILHYGERGSVRLYLTNHAEWDAETRRIRSYPHSVPVFVLEP
jgi:hypothetical protein